jgi:proline iminopeptidase
MSTHQGADPSSPHEGHVPVPGARLYFRAVGSGPPLVVLHGGPDFNHAYLLPDLDRLADSFRLFYYDQRGRGRSARGVDPRDVTIESEVDDLDRIRQHLGVDAMVSKRARSKRGSTSRRGCGRTTTCSLRFGG